MMRVVRHPCTGWQQDSLGETSSKVFGPDVTLRAAEVTPGGSSEGGAETDATVRTSATLYFAGRQVVTSPHDEWTVDGRRWEQAGEAEAWPLGTVVPITRRTG